MDLALYSEHGFYSTTGRAGRRGDFITSAEVGPLFGTVLARAIDDVWNRLGQPDNLLKWVQAPGHLPDPFLLQHPSA